MARSLSRLSSGFYPAWDFDSNRMINEGKFYVVLDAMGLLKNVAFTKANVNDESAAKSLITAMKVGFPVEKE